MEKSTFLYLTDALKEPFHLGNCETSIFVIIVQLAIARTVYNFNISGLSIGLCRIRNLINLIFLPDTGYFVYFGYIDRLSDIPIIDRIIIFFAVTIQVTEQFYNLLRLRAKVIPNCTSQS